MWTANIALLKEMIPQKYVEWLEKPYQLSAALQRVCHQLRVQVLYQRESVLADDERAFLQIPASDHHCYVRKVLLKGDDIPFCFGCITIPMATYEQYRHEFGALGDQLLGNTLLYANQKTTRSLFQYGLIDLNKLENHIPFNELKDSPMLDGRFPARRSIFYMDNEFPILVMEAFLAEIPFYQEFV